MTIATTRERVDRLMGLLAREREALAQFIAELAAFDDRRCWEDLGYPSLFEFLVRELRMSRGSAFYRTKAVGLVGRFPEVLEALREGKLCITAIAEVARVLTVENRADVLPRFFYASREDARLLSAEIAPRAVVPLREVVTPGDRDSSSLGEAAPAPALALPLAPAATPSEPAATWALPVHPVNCNDPKALDPTAQPAPAPEAPPATVVPMTAQLTRLHLTVTRELLSRVEAAQLALSHARPGATIADILELGADTALAKQARRRGLVKKPRRRRAVPSPSSIDAGYVPAEIRRLVWARDRGCCQWRLANGEICGSRYRAELDHIIPKGKGGETTVANLRVLCQRHNLLAARLAYGDEVMRRYVPRDASRSSARARRTLST